MEYIFALVIGYLLGSVNMAWLISKSRGINIKEVGSKNAGASNVFISVGKPQGVAVGAFDILKAFCAAEFISLIFPLNENAAVLAGAMAVIGHIYPFWMKFSGGKGLAPFMGLVLFMDWRVFLALGAVIIAITLITDFISIGTLAVITIMPVYAVIMRLDIFQTIIFFVLMIIMWYKHFISIKRIAKGEEIGFLRKNKAKV